MFWFGNIKLPVQEPEIEENPKPKANADCKWCHGTGKLLGLNQYYTCECVEYHGGTA